MYLSSKCCLAVIASWLLVVACSVAVPGDAPLPDSPVTLELYSTFQAMGITVTVMDASDMGGETGAEVEYRSGVEPYGPGFPLSRVGDRRFVGSLFWLEPGTSYDVRITLNDPEGGSLDGTTMETTGVTRQQVAIPDPVRSHYVAPGGDGKECSQIEPCALTEGLERAQPGDEVVLRGGVYHQGELNLPRSGTAAAPIVIRSHPNEHAILDGADPQSFHWTEQGDGLYRTKIDVRNPSLVVAAGERLYPYKNLSDLRTLSWNLPGFHVSGSELYVHLQEGADPNSLSMAVSRYDTAFYIDDDFIYFLDLTFRHYGRVTYAKAIFFEDASDNLVQRTTFILNNQGINIKGESHRNLIEENEFSDTLFDWNWDAVKKGGAQFVEAGGIFVNEPSTGRGNVIRRNTFHDMFDGLHICPERSIGTSNEIDVYENKMFRMADDGMETDGHCSNIRIWGNTVHDVLNGISLSPVETGPVYVMRNLIFNTGAGVNEHDGSPFKFIYGSSSDGPIYLFHNTAHTLLVGNDGIRIGGERGTWDTIVSRNNIWAGTRYALANFNSRQTLDFDYDALFTTSRDGIAKWEGLSNPALTTLIKLQAETGQELNGLNLDPGFVDPADSDYRLTSESELIDAGLVIPGINDQGSHAYLGQAPDIGALEFSPRP